MITKKVRIGRTVNPETRKKFDEWYEQNDLERRGLSLDDIVLAGMRYMELQFGEDEAKVQQAIAASGLSEAQFYKKAILAYTKFFTSDKAQGRKTGGAGAAQKKLDEAAEAIIEHNDGIIASGSEITSDLVYLDGRALKNATKTAFKSVEIYVAAVQEYVVDEAMADYFKAKEGSKLHISRQEYFNFLNQYWGFVSRPGRTDPEHVASIIGRKV